MSGGARRGREGVGRQGGHRAQMPLRRRSGGGLPMPLRRQRRGGGDAVAAAASSSLWRWWRVPVGQTARDSATDWAGGRHATGAREWVD